MTLSVSEALPDGPSLLLIACGVALAEQGRPWLSAGLLGVAGLGRENQPARRTDPPSWKRMELARDMARCRPRRRGRGPAGRLACLALACCPGAWQHWAEQSLAPIHGLPAKWSETLQELHANGWNSPARWSFLLLISLTVQFLMIFLRPQWTSHWWRIGAAYAS